MTGGPYTGNEGAAISLTGSASDAGSNDTLTYLWTVNASGIDAGGACSFDRRHQAERQDHLHRRQTAELHADPYRHGRRRGHGHADTTLTLQNVKPTIASLTKPDGTALPTTHHRGRHATN